MTRLCFAATLARVVDYSFKPNSRTRLIRRYGIFSCGHALFLELWLLYPRLFRPPDRLTMRVDDPIDVTGIAPAECHD